MGAPGSVRAHPFWLAWANRPARAIAWSLGLALAVVAGTLALNGYADAGWLATTRTTARVAFPLFLLAFVAGPLARLWPGPRTRALLARRRALGLAFATAQLVHGTAIGIRLARDPELLTPDVSFFGGALGFVFVAAMAATSNDAAQRALGGRAWRTLHRSGQWVLFAIFVVTWAGRLAEAVRPLPAAALLALGLALGLRIAAALQSRSLRSRTLPIE